MTLAVVAIFKNEAMIIREWIEHNIWQGVDRILLLDNNSTDDWKDKIKGLEDKLDIIHAPKAHAQIEHYNELALPWLKENKFDVVAIIDIDEYWFGKDGKKLKEIVVDIFSATPRPSKVYCKWMMFGSSGLKKQPKSIRKSFTMREDGEDCCNGKAIVWVNDIVPNGMDIHSTNVGEGLQVPCPENLQINHYGVMSNEYFKRAKQLRGDAFFERPRRPWSEFYNRDRNQRKNVGLAGQVKGEGSSEITL